MNTAGARLEPDATGHAQPVVRNARIHTGDLSQPKASAAAIPDGVFTAMRQLDTLGSVIRTSPS